MPKLSQKTLDKMFGCPYCGTKVRNRAGLSGHIQFKHSAGTYNNKKTTEDMISEIKDAEARLRAMGTDEEEIKEQTQSRYEWVLVRKLMDAQSFKESSADFKTYQLMRLVITASENRMKQWFSDELKK